MVYKKRQTIFRSLGLLCCVTLQGALLAVDADGEKAETEQTTRVCLKMFFPATRNCNLSWLP